MSRRTFSQRIPNLASLSVLAAIAVGLFATGLLAPAVAAAHDSLASYLFVPNRGSADVAVIDTRSDTLVARAAVGSVPHQVAVSAALGRLAVSNTEDNTVTVLGATTFETLATLQLDVTPEHMAVSPDGLTLAVGNIGAGTVSLIAFDTAREIGRVTGLIAPHNLTFGPDGSSLFVSNLGADHVSVVDIARAEVVKEIPVADPTPLASRAEGADTEYQGIINVTATPDGRLGFAAHGESNSLAVIDLATQTRIETLRLGELPWRAYGTADGRLMIVPNNGDRTVSIVEVATRKVIATLPGAADVTGVNTDAEGTTAFVISRGERRIVVLDLLALAPAGEIPLPGTPETGVVTPAGDKLYVALSDVGQVAVIDPRTRALIRTIDDVGAEPWGATMVGARNYCH